MLKHLKKIVSFNKNYLLLAAIVFYVVSIIFQQEKRNQYTQKQAQQNIQQYITQQEKNFIAWCSGLNFIEDVQKGNITNKNFGVGLYEFVEESFELIAWNNLNFTDTQATHFARDTSYLIENSLGYFECVTKHIYANNTTYLAYALIPIQYHFATTQQYQNPIKNYFNYYKIDSKQKNLFPIYNSQQQWIFDVATLQPIIDVPYAYITIFTRLVSIFFICLYIHITAVAFAKKSNFTKGLIFLASVLLVLRGLTYFLNIPFVFSKLALFDPTIFATNFLHPSLGDLLINLLLLFWVINFFEKRQKNLTSNTSKTKWMALVQLAIIVLISFVFIDLIKSLVIDSKIPFDVENFFNLNEYTAIAFAAICLIIINYVKISNALYQSIIQQKVSIFFQLVVVVVTGIAGIVIETYFTKYNITFTLVILCWLVVFVGCLYLFETKHFFSKKNYILSLYWILFFTTSTAAIIVFFEEKLELEQRQQLAEKIYLSNQSNENFGLTELQSNEYSYALYQNGKLKENDGSYLFYRHQSPYNVGFTIENNSGESKLVYQATKDVAIVLVKQTQHLLNFVTLFAYLFFSFVLVVFLLFIVLKLAVLKINFWKSLKEKFYSIDTQIKTTILLLSAASFITVGFVSIYFYNKKFNAANDDKILKALSTINQVSSLISLTDTSLHDIISDAETKNNVIIDIYDTDGKLIEKSSKLGKKNNFIAQQMNFTAYQTIYQQHELYFKQQEENYGEKFYSFYKPLLNKSGETIGCINIPDINYQKFLRQDLSGFIATLININAFIFLLAAAIAFIVTNRITSSFTLIKNKMKAINWQSQNDEIEWNRNDEIGALVKEYNLMVRKLDETAKAFAQSQKEVAWKEMAKQVAHEIKNPLTPMKLSIQYLQNKIAEDAPNIKQLSATVATTLVEQINQLSNIASDFSQFANISNTNAETIDLIEIIKSVVTLFGIHNNVMIECNNVNTPHFVFADKTQITRLFTNLIKNAIEATNDVGFTKIIIEKQIQNNYIIISLQDNGTGIPEELHHKIFTINFTTKNSGTGLGLAICKGIVENANGNIWFETSNTGTTFFVELPLVEKNS